MGAGRRLGECSASVMGQPAEEAGSKLFHQTLSCFLNSSKLNLSPGWGCSVCACPGDKSLWFLSLGPSGLGTSWISFCPRIYERVMVLLVVWIDISFLKYWDWRSNTQLAGRDEKTRGCAPICVSVSVHVEVLIDGNPKGKNTFLCGKGVGHCH